MDSLSQAYADLLTGTYDCPDRIVLNAYFRSGHIPGGFRLWWRQLQGNDEQLDDAHLMRLAGRFSRRLRAYAQKHHIPVIECQRGERKHQIAQPYRPADPHFSGLFVILVGRASAPTWHVQKSKDGRIQNLVRKYAFVNHYYFHILDPDWGHVTVRMSSHPPFGAQVILNGHEFVARLAQQQGLDLPQDGNCFTAIIGPADSCQAAETLPAEQAIGPLAAGGDKPGLTQLAETLCSPNIVGPLRQVCDRWLYSTCLHFGLSLSEQEQSHFHYQYSVFQVEYSRNLLFKRPCQLEQCFQALLDRTRSRLGIEQLKTIFGVKRRPCYTPDRIKRPPREEVVVARPQYNLTIFKLHFGRLTVKLYSKGACVLRSEVIVHNTKALNGKRSLAAFPQIVTELQAILHRFLDHLHTLDRVFVADELLDTVAQPSQMGQAQVAGIDWNKPRLRAVLAAVIALAVTPRGFTISALAAKVREHLALPATAYGPRQAAYDLKKLRGKHWVEKESQSRRYLVSPLGLQAMSALLILREHVLKPLLAAAGREPGGQPRPDNEIDQQYRIIHHEMRSLFHLLGVVV